MHSKIPYGPLLLSMMMLGLAGCAEFEARKGPAPVISGAAVQNASSNKEVILDALAADARIGPNSPFYYYEVAEAGFNFVDDQCRSYFDNLFFLQRRRDEFKSGLASSAATTATILGVTNATVPTLTIVAAAFGLASSATDIVAGTYLYTQPPAITQGFVERLQLAYRAGAANNRALINTPTSAYYQIQRYLNLCLPPTIEAEITRQISSSSAVFVPSGAGAFFDVQSVGAPASALPRVGEAPGSFRGAGPGSVSPDRGATTGPSGPTRGQPAHAHEPVKPTEALLFGGLTGAITPSEKQMRADELARIQRNVLCIVPENPTFDMPTREGIKIFQKASPPLPVTGQIGVEDRKKLLGVRGSCPSVAKNYFERSNLFKDDGTLDSDYVTKLQVALNNKQPEDKRIITQYGQLDDPTRKTITAVSRGLGLSDPSAEGQVTFPLLKALGL